MASYEENVPAIKAVNLTKRFGKRVSVDNLNLTIQQGELYALLGDNGAGKTTTLNMLTTLLKPSAGEFYICGLNGISQSEETKGVFGVISQDVAIYNELTAYENLAFIASLYKLPKATTEQRIKELLTQAGLIERAHDLVGTFSGGMQRRLSIANALLHQPPVLFMDEPTVGLDPAARRQIWATLANLREQGVTILLTTHYLEEAEVLADRIGIIRQGKLVAEGTIAQLREKIQPIRNIEVRLSIHLPSEEIQAHVANAESELKMQVEYDAIHNALLFAKLKDTLNGVKLSHDGEPHNNKLLRYSENVLRWLQESHIPVASFSINEPNLEEVFLAVSKNHLSQVSYENVNR